MKAVIQRVSQASVTVGGQEVGRIQKGLVVLLGITHTDTMEQIPAMTRKILDVCYFEDDAGRLGKSVRDVGGQVLVVSQFTVYGLTDKGRKLNFSAAAPGVIAEPLYLALIAQLRASGVPVATGTFGAMMEVSLVNEGPVTVIVDV
jgi:D-tyrosyl-tRNA(Tyr) deacylase